MKQDLKTNDAGSGARKGRPGKPMQFSIMFFASDAARQQDDKYGLVMSCAEFADRAGFTATWIPERHFHRFGGPFPNPAVLGAAIAAKTSSIRIRAGSVILPLHDPIRVAEEWSMVDNLSRGRVDLAFGQGWNPNDFALAPDRFGDRLQSMYRDIEQVRALWRGRTVARRNGVGAEVEIGAFPPPLQEDLNVWITCSGGHDRFIEAGAMGANVLTALLFQDIEETAAKIRSYREARARHGFDPDTGHVTLMMHTFIGASAERVRATVRAPMLKYLEDSVDLWRQQSRELEGASEEERAKLLEFALLRYLRTHSLCGTPESHAPLVEELARIGVDEIACLLDFGVAADQVLASLPFLQRLRELSAGRPADQVPAQRAVEARGGGK